jgi:Flp pilus assembly protein TadG
MAVEFVIAVPAFLLLLLLVAGGGNWVSDSGQVGGAARDAARMASLARSYSDANDAAKQAAQGDLGGLCTDGLNVSPPTLIGGTTFATATAVSVTVSCRVNLAMFSIVDLNKPTPFSATSVAPLDPFVTRTS